MSYIGRAPAALIGNLVANTIAVSGNSTANVVAANTVAFIPTTAPNLPEGDVYYDAASHQLMANTGATYTAVGGSLPYANPNLISISLFE